LISDGALVLCTKPAIAGNRYRCDLDISAIAGSIKEINGSAVFSTTGAKSVEFTDVGNGLGLARNAACNATFTNLRFKNISSHRWDAFASTGTLATGYLAQATPANMGWKSTSGRPSIQFDGTADYMASNLLPAALPFHKTAGFTFSLPYKANVDGVLHYLFNTANSTVVSAGISFAKTAANKVSVHVMNGSGVGFAMAYSSLATVLAASAHAVSGSWSEAGGLRLLIDDSAAETLPTVSPAGVADASSALRIGTRPALDVFFPGRVNGLVLRVGALDGTSLARLHKYQRAYGGV